MPVPEAEPMEAAQVVRPAQRPLEVEGHVVARRPASEVENNPCSAMSLRFVYSGMYCCASSSNRSNE